MECPKETKYLEKRYKRAYAPSTTTLSRNFLENICAVISTPLHPNDKQSKIAELIGKIEDYLYKTRERRHIKKLKATMY